MAKDSQTSKKLVAQVVELLRTSDLSNEDRQLLTTVVLTRLGVLPLRASITQDTSGVLFLNGKQPDLEVAKQLRESSRSMLDNFARKFVRETVTFMAIKQGVHENTSPEQGLFAKAALWQIQEEQILFETLAQVGDDTGVQDA